uniref:IRG-type G domain-containing protein n=1 Tax=Panagrolaimus davidi TaxID=227884 RepID=A0A914QHJ7_9BILA
MGANKTVEYISIAFKCITLAVEVYDYFNQRPKHDIVVPDDMEETVRKAKAALKLDTLHFFNFGVAGHSKTGKSSLINAIRGLEDDDYERGAAEVDVTETTHEITQYGFPNPLLKDVRIYDIPGAGTLTHDANNYYQDKRICAFDTVIICIQESVCREEIDFAIQCIKYNQPIVFVRSRCDTVMDNLKKQKRITQVDQAAVDNQIQKMSEAFKREIERTKIAELRKVPCFFISAYSLRDHMNGKESDVYQEKLFIDFIIAESKRRRNIVF